MLTVAVIGIGRRSLSVMDTLHNSGKIQFVAAADSWQDALKEGEKRFALKPYTNVTKMLKENRDLDFVMIGSRDFEHEKHVKTALKYGNDIFCEKPMSITPASAKRMIKAVEEAKARFYMGFNLRYHPVYVKAKKIIQSGAFVDSLHMDINPLRLYTEYCRQAEDYRDFQSVGRKRCK